jgi:uncharacterized protein YbjT (DUF2867 family)
VTPLHICLLGGTGFVGHAIAARLAPAGHRLRVLTRAAAAHRDMSVLPGLTLVEGDPHDDAFLRRQFHGVDAVINLIGILNERGHSGRGFEVVHAGLPAKVVAACVDTGVARLLHMSALGASLDASSHYLRTKAKGEDVAHAAAPELRATSFRPSVIFGRRDSFTNRFARLLTLAPGVFPLACADARFQPVYVDDVARAFEYALGAYRTIGQRYDLCGPKIYRLQEIVEYIARLKRRRVRVIRLNDRLSRLQASILEYVPGKPFSRDNYDSLRTDSVCAGRAALLEVFGIVATPLESVAPGYLGVPPS